MAVVAHRCGRHSHFFRLLGLHFSAHLLVILPSGMNDAYSRREYEQFTCRAVIDLAALSGYNSALRG